MAYLENDKPNRDFQLVYRVIVILSEIKVDNEIEFSTEQHFLNVRSGCQMSKRVVPRYR